MSTKKQRERLRRMAFDAEVAEARRVKEEKPKRGRPKKKKEVDAK